MTSDMNKDCKTAEEEYSIRPEVVNYDDVSRWIPALKGHRKLVNGILHFLAIDKVNDVHRRNCATPGIPFSQALIDKEFKIKLDVDNIEALSASATEGLSSPSATILSALSTASCCSTLSVRCALTSK